MINIFKFIFLKGNILIAIEISLKVIIAGHILHVIIGLGSSLVPGRP